jgi:hypothetical protein
LIVARRDLSTAFWSAARLLDGFLAWIPVSCIPIPLLFLKSYLWLLSLLEELGLTGLLVTSLTSEVLLAGDLLDLLGVESRDIDLVGCGNNVASVDAADWDTVDLEWAGNEENALGEVVQEDDTLAAETTSEEDENGAWDEGGSWGGSTDGLADL